MRGLCSNVVQPTTNSSWSMSKSSSPSSSLQGFAFLPLPPLAALPALALAAFCCLTSCRACAASSASHWSYACWTDQNVLFNRHTQLLHHKLTLPHPAQRHYMGCGHQESDEGWLANSLPQGTHPGLQPTCYGCLQTPSVPPQLLQHLLPLAGPASVDTHMFVRWYAW